MMSSEEEPKSQFDFTLHGHMNEKDSPPAFVREAHAYRERVPARSNAEPGSDDTIPEVNSATVSSPRLPIDALKSQVEETQYVTLELDTQPTTEFDVSPITRRVLDNTDSIWASVPPPPVDAPLLERRDTPDIDVSDFRYGPAPKKSLNLSRPHKPPRRDQEAATVETQKPVRRSLQVNALDMITTSLPSRGGPPKAIFTFEQPRDAALLATQNSITDLSDERKTHNSQSRDPTEPRSHPETAGTNYVAQSRSNVPSPRLPAINKPPFKDAIVTLKVNTDTNRLNRPEIKSVPEQSPQPQNRPRRSPPFMEEVSSKENRAKAIEISTIAAIPDYLQGAAAGPEVLKLANIRSAKANSPEPRLVTEPIENHDTQERLISMENNEQQSITTHELQGAMTQEEVYDGDMVGYAAFNSDLRESRPPLHDLPINNRQKSRSRDDGIRTPKIGGNKLPPNRPLSGHQVQPQDMRKNQNLHGTRDSRVSKRAPSKIKIASSALANNQLQDEASKPITSAEMMHMAVVMANTEKEERDEILALTQLQEVQIIELSDAKAELQDQIILLEEENGKLSETNGKFRQRCEKYRAHINDVIGAQKELMAAAKRLEKKKFDFVRESAIKMDAELSKIKASLSAKSREILREAREKIDSQEKLVALLNRDLDNRLLELQRERGLTERLQKQLEDREKQQEELKLILLNQEQNTTTILAGHEDIIRDALNTGADRGTRLDECLTLIKTINESRAKSLPALNELTQLILALSTSVENKLQEAEYGSVHIREAGVEVLAELRKRLKMLSEDQATQQELTASITQLREENATLNERIQNRESELAVANDQLNELKLDLQECRSQLVATTEDLSSALTAPREDPVLRLQLHDLQTSYSVLRDQAESYSKEIGIARVDLRMQEESNALAQQEISKLQEQLRQTQAEVSTFEVQKETYVRQVRDESDKLRMQMERDVRARLAEDEAYHNGIVSGLQRQAIEAEAKLVRMQKDLHGMEQTGAGLSSEARGLSEEVSVIGTWINTQSTSLGFFQEKLHEMEERRDLAARELYISREQLTQFEKEAAEWTARAEENALLFEKRCNQTNEEAKKSEETAEIEVNRLRSEAVGLRKKIEGSLIFEDNLVRWLRDKGLLKTGMTLKELVAQLPVEPTQPEQAHLVPTGLQVVGEPFYEVHSLSQDNSAYGSQTNDVASAVQTNENQAQAVIPRDLAFPKPASGAVPDTATPSSVLLSQDTGERLQESDISLFRQEKAISDSVSSSKRMIRETSKRHSIMKESSPERPSILMAPGKLARPFPDTTVIPGLYSRAGDHIGNPITDFGGGNLLNGIARTVIPDSQDDSTQEQTQNLVQPPQRIAQRQNSIAIQPQMRESNRTITRTEVTEYSVIRSETYADTSTAQKIIGAAPFGRPATELNSLEQDDDSGSSLTDPPSDSDLELMEFLDDYTGKDQKLILKPAVKKPRADSTTIQSVLSPKSNTSRVRTAPSMEAVKAGEMRPPKSILKRTNSNLHSTETVSSFHSSAETVRSSEVSKVPSVHQGTAVNKRLSRPKIGSKGLDGAPYNSPYNRIVSGTKASYKTNDFPAPGVPSNGPQTPVTDMFAVASSSPTIGQPLRNSKKHVLSRVGIDDNHRSAKLPRLGKH